MRVPPSAGSGRPSQPKTRGFVAADADTAVLLCRESSRLTTVWRLTWVDGEPRLQKGSTFSGRLYPDRCALSPDGERFLYFAMGDGRGAYPERLYCWTALCAPPWLTALKLWPHGDTWGGGGCFLQDGRLFIDPGMHPGFGAHKSDAFEGATVLFRMPPEGRDVDPWRLVTLREDARGGVQPDCWRRDAGGWLLQRILTDYADGAYSCHRYRIVHAASGRHRDLDGVHWMDGDRQGRMMQATGRSLQIHADADAVLAGDTPRWQLRLE